MTTESPYPPKVRCVPLMIPAGKVDGMVPARGGGVVSRVSRLLGIAVGKAVHWP